MVKVALEVWKSKLDQWGYVMINIDFPSLLLQFEIEYVGDLEA